MFTKDFIVKAMKAAEVLWGRMTIFSKKEVVPCDCLHGRSLVVAQRGSRVAVATELNDNIVIHEIRENQLVLGV